MASRQFDKAIEQLHRVVELNRKSTWPANGLAAVTKPNPTTWLLSKSTKGRPDIGRRFGRDPEAYNAWQQALDSRGERGYWEKKLEDLKPDAGTPEERDPREIAGCYAKLGKPEKALDEIEEHFDEMTIWNALKFEPMFDTLHNEARSKHSSKGQVSRSEAQDEPVALIRPGYFCGSYQYQSLVGCQRPKTVGSLRDRVKSNEAA